VPVDAGDEGLGDLGAVADPDLDDDVVVESDGPDEGTGRLGWCGR
jgi:hypothetical protein